MFLFQGLIWTILSINAFLISRVRSAPTSHSLPKVYGDSFSFADEKADFPDLILHRDIYRRDKYPSFLSNWQIFSDWLNHIDKDPSASPTMEVPDGVPTGRETSDLTYQYQHKEDGVVTERSLDLVSILGKGSFGIIYQGKLTIPNDSEEPTVAVKWAAVDPGGLINGAILQRSISSDSILSIEDYFFVAKENAAFLIMPEANRGTLSRWLEKLYDDGQSEINKIFKKIVTGVVAMQESTAEYPDGIIHRDLKPSNILIHGVQPKISDFDQATAVASSTQYAVGTIGFMAPEILKLKPYTKKSDVFSLGMIWLIMSSEGLQDKTEQLKIWKKFIEAETQIAIKNILVETLKDYDEEMADGMLDLISTALCEVEKRIDVVTFQNELEKLSR